MKENRKRKFRRKTQPPEGYMTTQQAAEYLGVCERSIRRYIKQYGLPASKPAGHYFIERIALEKWIKENG